MTSRRAISMVATLSDALPLVDVLVVGGGVVGLAVARAIHGRSVFLVEKEKKFGQGVSSRSSEVVHAGIYYPKGSLKAKWCVEGRRLLKKYCEDRGIPYQQRGKLIVSTDVSQESALRKVAEHARANGVGDDAWEELKHITGEEAKKMEPELRCHSALFSPSTAVIDSHEYMAALEAEASEGGVNFVYGSSFIRATRFNEPAPHFLVELRSDNGSKETVACSSIINCAGLFAPGVALSIKTGMPSHDKSLPTAYFCKGNYFKPQGIKNPFQHLIYPLPEAHGLGVHLTIDTGGNARFGPDVEWLNKLDSASFVVNPERANVFYSAIRSYWPGLPDDCLVPDYAGIRPKLGPPSMPASDFVVLDPTHHGVPGLIHCLGIESPGLTSSLALARHIADIVTEFE